MVALFRMEDQISARMLHSPDPRLNNIITNDLLVRLQQQPMNDSFLTGQLYAIDDVEYELVALRVDDKGFNGAFILFIEKSRLGHQPFLQFLDHAWIGLKGAASIIQTYTVLENLTTRFNAILETIPESIVYIDDFGKNGWINATAAVLLGLKPGFNAPVEIAQSMQMLRSKAYNRDEINTEAKELFSSPNKKIFGWKWIFDRPASMVLNVSCVPAVSKNVKGRLWVFADVTALHQQNEMLNELNIELEEKRQIADTQNKAKTEFLANISHEIRTPMNGVIGMASLLAGTDLSEEQKEYVDSIVFSGENLLVLINDLLDLSKIESGMMEIESHPFDPGLVVAEVVKLMKAKAMEKGLEISYNVLADIPSAIISDSYRLRQVLLNLVSNAIKFTDTGAITITANKIDTDNGSLELQFTVTDTGIGIPADKYDRLFRDYSQVDTSTTRNYGGTGLGLAICQKIVRLMGGKIWAEKNEERGSRFRFTIKALSSDNVQASRKSSNEIISQQELLPINILVAEDHPINQRFITKSLEKLGYQITLVNNGKEALDAVKNGAFHLILMDVMMPEMDGYTATEQIRSLEDKHQPVIIATTAGNLSSPEEKEKIFASGMDDYLPKPFRINDIAAKLDQWRNSLEKIYSDAQYFDPEPVAELVNAIGSKEELLALYTELNKKEVIQLQAAIEAVNYNAIFFIAHKLTGSLSFLGIAKLFDIASKIEALAKAEGDIEEITGLLQELKQEYPEMLNRLKTHFKLT